MIYSTSVMVEVVGKRPTVQEVIVQRAPHSENNGHKPSFREAVMAKFTSEEKTYWLARYNNLPNLEWPNVVLTSAVTWSEIISDPDNPQKALIKIQEALIKKGILDSETDNAFPKGIPVRDYVSEKIKAKIEKLTSKSPGAHIDSDGRDLTDIDKTTAAQLSLDLVSFTLATTTLSPEQQAEYLRSLRDTYEELTKDSDMTEDQRRLFFQDQTDSLMEFEGKSVASIQ